VGPPWPSHGPDDLDDEQRARIRRQVLGNVRPLRRTFGDRLGDRAYDVLAVLALPTPHIIRAIVAVAVIVSIIGTASVASADALPEQPLYAVKVAGEQVRLVLARTSEDRASVELSMAEHRLTEAERLALDGRGSEALVATSAYGTHLANAAAELAAIERLNAAAQPVIDRLKQRLAQQQQHAAAVAARLVDDPVTTGAAQLFQTVASFAPALPSGSTVSEGIAAHAANIAGQLATVAERLAEEAEAAEAAAEREEDEDEEEEGAETPPTSGAAATEPARAPARATVRPTDPRATAAPQRTPARPTPAAIGAVRGPQATRAAPTPKATAKAKATVDPKKAADTQAAKAAREKAKHEAEKARSAAEKAKEAAKRTATPKPSPKR